MDLVRVSNFKLGPELFDDGLNLWYLSGLLHRLNAGNLSLHHDRDIDHLIRDLQLRYLRGLLNSLGHGTNLLLHINEHVINLVKELHLWNLDVLGHLVDFLIDDGLLSVLCLFDEFWASPLQLC